MSEERTPYLTHGQNCGLVPGMKSEMPLKDELKQSGNRHSRRLIAKLSEILSIPAVAQDSIRQELEYATLDGYRITMKHTSGTEENNAQDEYYRTTFGQ